MSLMPTVSLTVAFTEMPIAATGLDGTAVSVRSLYAPAVQGQKDHGNSDVFAALLKYVSSFRRRQEKWESDGGNFRHVLN